MGDEAEALAEQMEDGSYWYTDDNGRERWGHGQKRRKKRASAPKTGSHHHPANDAEAKSLIERLGHFDWDTHKVSGRYSRAPYTLVAVIDGIEHSIHLPGRFGTTLSWLKGQVEANHE